MVNSTIIYQYNFRISGSFLPWGEGSIQFLEGNRNIYYKTFQQNGKRPSIGYKGQGTTDNRKSVW